MAQRRLRIGIDIDGVLIDTDPKDFLDFCEKELGWNVNYEVYMDTHSWLTATGQASDRAIGEAFEQFVIQVEESQKPIDGAHDSLKNIAKVADMYLITARAGILRQVTEEFMGAHLPDVTYHGLSMDNFEKKSGQILDFGVDFYIDDSYREISLILQNGAVNTKIIPFPAFHGAHRWDEVEDDRVHWLSVWDDVEHGLPGDLQVSIRKKAWEEIAGIVLQSAAGTRIVNT